MTHDTLHHSTNILLDQLLTIRTASTMSTGSVRRGQLTTIEINKNLCEAACKEKGYNPFEELIDIATETVDVEVKGKIVKLHKASAAERIKIACEIGAYLDSKQKNSEPIGTDKGNNTFNITINRFGTQPAKNTGKEIKEAVVDIQAELSK